MRDNLRHNLRKQTEFLRNSANTSQNGVNTSSVFSSKAWNMAPNEIKHNATLNIFKEKVRKWEEIVIAKFACHAFRILDI